MIIRTGHRPPPRCPLQFSTVLAIKLWIRQRKPGARCRIPWGRNYEKSTRGGRKVEEGIHRPYELSPSVESVPRRRCPTRVPNMSSREGGASGSFDALVAAVSVIVGSPCSCPTRNKSTALRTPRGDSEENWSIAKISLVLHATSDLFSLSLSLSRGSAVDLREMEEQGSDFHRRTSVQYSLGQGRRGGSTR